MSERFKTINQLSEQTGIDRRTLKKRLAGLKTQKGTGKGNYYDCHEALQAVFAPESRSSIEKQLQEQALIYESARAEKMKLDVERLRGEVVPIAEVAKEVAKEYTYVRAQVRAISSKIAKPISIKTGVDPHEVLSLCDDVINECLTELTADAKYEEQRIELESSQDDTPDDSQSDVEADTETESSSVG
jgi:hypothetical protein